MVEGSRSLRNPKINALIDQYKQEITAEKKLDVAALVQKYIDIAFADITDYLSFGQRDQQVMGIYGPLFEKDKKTPIMETINFVDLHDSDEIDGTIVSEVKQGKDGISVKLADRMKALDMLAKYFDMLPDEAKQKNIQLMQARIDGIKDEIKRKNNAPEKPDISAYIDALKGKASEVWNHEKE
jgi:phage terminase small subunit